MTSTGGGLNALKLPSSPFLVKRKARTFHCRVARTISVHSAVTPRNSGDTEKNLIEGTVGQVFRKEFQSDEAVELDVLGFVNDAQPATAEFFDDAVDRKSVV